MPPRRLAAVVAAAAVAGAGAAAASGRPGRVVRVERPASREVVVPAGSFQMGVDDDAASAASTQCLLAYFPPSAAPRLAVGGQQLPDLCSDYLTELTSMAPRTVFLDAFAIDRDEVTVDDYRRCVAAGGCTLDAMIAGDERYIHGAWPLVNVTWEEAGTYCHWRGARLPTEAEWERAARGDAPAAQWPWGDLEQPKDFNHGQPRAVAMREIERHGGPLPLEFFGDPDDSDGHVLLAPPGSYPWGASPWGTRDQAGNVAEWTADAYIHDDEHRGYLQLPIANPRREGGVGAARVVRGGSWRQPAFVARSNLRDPFSLLTDATQRYTHIGFRCARSLRAGR